MGYTGDYNHRMGFWHIRATNCEFETRDEGRSYDTPEHALASGVRAVIAIVSEKVGRGVPTSAIEVSVETPEAKPLLRAVVALSVSPLYIA